MFKRELPQSLIDNEFNRKMALECGKRCFTFKYEGEKLLKIQPAEELCLNRCIGKLMNVKEVVDEKLIQKNLVELPPILYNQNLQ